MLNDPLANALSVIMNSESRSMKNCLISPSSKIIKTVLGLMNEHKYLGKFTEKETAKGTVLSVELLGSINKCGAVKPRYSAKHGSFEKFEKRYLPAKDFGFLAVSTPKGIMTHTEAKQKSLGGRLIAYFY